MADPTPPRRGLSGQADRLKRIDGSVRDLQRPSGTQRYGAVAKLSEQVRIFQTMQHRQYAEFTSGRTGFSGWGASPCSVDITSGTGRIEVAYGGSLNGGDGYFCFNVVRIDTGAAIVPRDSIQTNPARRVAVSGGASFAPSGYRTMPVDVPADVPVRVALQIFAGDSFTYFFGGSIAARVVA